MYSFDRTYELGDSGLSFGENFSSAEANNLAREGEGSTETRLQNRRALISILNQVGVYGVDTGSSLGSRFLPQLLVYLASADQIPIAKDTRAYSFLHELAAQAGRMNRGAAALHGDPTVESIVEESKAKFPNGVETAHTIRVSDAPAQAARNMNRPSVSPSAGGRTPPGR